MGSVLGGMDCSGCMIPSVHCVQRLVKRQSSCIGGLVDNLPHFLLGTTMLYDDFIEVDQQLFADMALN